MFHTYMYIMYSTILLYWYCLSCLFREFNFRIISIRLHFEHITDGYIKCWLSRAFYCHPYRFGITSIYSISCCRQDSLNDSLNDFSQLTNGIALKCRSNQTNQPYILIFESTTLYIFINLHYILRKAAN